MFIPSTALRTEIAGVIIASPKNRDAPASPTMSTKPRYRPAAGRARESSAIVPPSPWLSARITTTTYLMATTSVMAQNTSESTPRTVVSASAPVAAFSNSRKA